MSSVRFTLPLCSVLVGLASSVNGQIMNDGNLDALAPGTAPDVAQGAGAWAFPPNYVADGFAEPAVSPGMFSIVPTSTFQPGAAGNSLRLHNPGGTELDNVHLPNLWAQTFTRSPGLVLRISFNLWVEPGAGGGTVYIGGDNGGGGYDLFMDRAAQLSWWADGTMRHTTNSGVHSPLTPFAPGIWQNVVIEIDANARNYDVFWSMGSDPPSQVGYDLGFRAQQPAWVNFYDRFTFVQFGSVVPNAQAYLDNVVVQAIPAPGAAALLALGAGAARRRR